MNITQYKHNLRIRAIAWKKKSEMGKQVCMEQFCHVSLFWTIEKWLLVLKETLTQKWTLFAQLQTTFKQADRLTRFGRRGQSYWNPTKQRLLETDTIFSASLYIIGKRVSLAKKLKHFDLWWMHSIGFSRGGYFCKVCSVVSFWSFLGLWKVTSHPKIGHIYVA